MLQDKTSPNRRDIAIQTWLEKGGSKADALRKAGFSDSVVDKPSKVFNTEYAMGVLERAGVDLDGALKQLNRKVTSRKLEHLTFPPFNEEKHDKSINGDISDDLVGDLNDTDSGVFENTGKKHGEQLTDDQIREMLLEVNCVVRKIVHGDNARHVYFWSDNDKAQLEAIEKIINLHGLYAPKKTEQKNTNVFQFSMSGLRKKAIDSGNDIIEIETEAVQTIEQQGEQESEPATPTEVRIADRNESEPTESKHARLVRLANEQ